MHLLALPAALSVLTYTSALPSISSSSSPKPLPLLIWHGLGDTHDAEGLHSVGSLAESIHPQTYTYYIRIDDDSGEDRKATFFGNLTAQVEKVCGDIQADPKLLDPTTGTIRVDALGFSQGGQFLRGLVQTCEGLSVRSLVTFGSQHNGIAELKACGTWDLLCKGALALARGNIWSAYVQSHVIPAQYFRSVNDTTGLGSEEYLSSSGWLARMNNELEVKNSTYKQRISELENFVMFIFEEDTTVIPKESGWFAEVNGTDGKVTELRERRMFKEDWLGLRELDEKGGLVFETTEGEHMQLDEEVLRRTFGRYFGPERRVGRASVEKESIECVERSWVAWFGGLLEMGMERWHAGL
ncbi:unnamed protein product [Zymoseptoria tritici ST99CH_1A5]|uniref:Palmitoyl-protein thioesterase 1 n=3 Tax=Zymoseptoria tritici TaxID=1047171 RepID=A0A1X7S552_ZYMT9|nr:unnamed protein product [Zymoseptoria tritici ST99CH_3D7]SMY28405.1 unnamed protein product [Zymoseptoria tritici ST99CH_1A5]